MVGIDLHVRIVHQSRLWLGNVGVEKTSTLYLMSTGTTPTLYVLLPFIQTLDFLVVMFLRVSDCMGLFAFVFYGSPFPPVCLSSCLCLFLLWGCLDVMCLYDLHSYVYFIIGLVHS